MVGALDTKGVEISYLRDLIACNGVEPVIVDIGFLILGIRQTP